MTPPVYVGPDPVIEMIDGHMRRRVALELAEDIVRRETRGAFLAAGGRDVELEREAFRRGGIEAQRRRRATSRGARV